MSSQIKEPATVRECILNALSVEDENPREAMKLYRQAKQQNEEFNVLIFIVSFTAPILACVLALRPSRISGRFSTILAFAIVAYIGVGVSVMLRAFRDRRNGVAPVFAPEGSSWFWINAVLAGPLLFIRGMLLILNALLLAVMTIAPLVAILVLSDNLKWGITDNLYIMTPVYVLAALA